MKDFLLKIVLFSILIIGLAFGLSEIEFGDDFIIEKTKETAYEKVGWNLEVINNRKNEIKNSVVFFGSSYVLNGVNDSVLKSNGIKAINLAIKHNGNDLSLFFLKRILVHQPKEVVFLKGKTFFGGLHKITPLLYSPVDLLSDGQSINLEFFKYLFKRSKISLEFLYFKLKNTSLRNIKFDEKYGVRYEISSLDIDTFFSESEILRWQKEEERYNLYQNSFLYKSEKSETEFFKKIITTKRRLTLDYYSRNNFVSNCLSQERFVNTANELCKTNNVQFSQIYMPVVFDVFSHPTKNISWFMRLKSDSDKLYYFTDYDFLKNNTFWTDEHHLSKLGSIKFTKELVNSFK